MLDELRELLTEQDRFQACKQEVTRRIHALEEHSGKLAAFLEAGVKEHHGTRSERLAEFGLQPFRSQRRGKPEGEEPDSVEALTGSEAPERNTP
jgi:hypothetical protein